MTRDEALQIYNEVEESKRKLALRSNVELRLLKEIQKFFEDNGPFPEDTTVRNIMTEAQLLAIIEHCCAAEGITRSYYDAEVASATNLNNIQRARFERAINVLGLADRITPDMLQQVEQRTTEDMRKLGLTEEEIIAIRRDEETASGGD